MKWGFYPVIFYSSKFKTASGFFAGTDGNNFVKNEDDHVKKAFVLSNVREITTNGKIMYLPIYDVMFLGANMACKN